MRTRNFHGDIWSRNWKLFVSLFNVGHSKNINYGTIIDNSKRVKLYKFQSFMFFLVIIFGQVPCGGPLAKFGPIRIWWDTRPKRKIASVEKTCSNYRSLFNFNHNHIEFGSSVLWMEHVIEDGTFFKNMARSQNVKVGLNSDVNYLWGKPDKKKNWALYRLSTGLIE